MASTASAGELSFPASYAQQRLWLLERMLAAGSVYNVGHTLRLSGELDVAALSELPALELPTDRRRPPVASYRGGRVAFEVPAALTSGLKALSRREGATLFMTLLAAFQVLLSRYSGQDGSFEIILRE
jgi:hypothetical protein